VRGTTTSMKSSSSSSEEDDERFDGGGGLNVLFDGSGGRRDEAAVEVTATAAAISSFVSVQSRLTDMNSWANFEAFGFVGSETTSTFTGSAASSFSLGKFEKNQEGKKKRSSAYEIHEGAMVDG
jgi:hypothetical protein